MRIAILGATSQIARDLTGSFAAMADDHLHLFVRRSDEVSKWNMSQEFSGRYPVDCYSEFPKHEFDAIINFVGVGNPARAAALGNSIFDVTLRFDEMALEYLRAHHSCRYLFLSSGAAYGAAFNAPAKRDTQAVVAINDLASHEWYGVAKLHAECRHRACSDFNIFDIRVFNYFSHTQDINARFLITDILRAIRDKAVLKTSPDYIVRDFLHPSDFYRLVRALLDAPRANVAVDCYSRAPVDKPALLAMMQEEFGLRYEIAKEAVGVNATGIKPYYYSLNRRAAELGYLPGLTSLEGILQESRKILGLARGTPHAVQTGGVH